MTEQIKIMIVEDEPVVLQMLSDTISKLGSNFKLVGTAFNGRAGKEKILELKPDIVITDIQMPILSGLDMLREVRDQGAKPRTIILSGFNEFEYARAAMHLNVDEYLLKPVDKEQLVQLVQKLGQQVQIAKNQNLQSFIRSCIGLEEPVNGNDRVLNQAIHLFFIFLGPITRRIYGELSRGAEYWKHHDLSFTEELGRKWGCTLIHFPGKYPNERIFAAIWNDPATPLAEQLAQELFDRLPKDLAINLIGSKLIHNRDELVDSAIRSALCAISRNHFGHSQIFWIDDYSGENQMPQIDEGFRNQVKALVYLLNSEQAEEVLRSLVTSWEIRKITQLQLQVELEYLLSRIHAVCSNEQKSVMDPSELISSSYSFDDLFQVILSEISRIGTSRDIDQGNKSLARDLIGQIEAYLKEHFNQNITYKDLYEKFGYSEKYLADLFKKEIGVSPSQYLTTLRIKQAQAIMLGNPTILLKDIAQMVGYSDPLYFSRVFKDVTGSSPTNYIRKVKQSDL